VSARWHFTGRLLLGAPLFVFVHRDGASVADSAVRARLRRVKHCAAGAAPRHMPPIAGTPDRADRPAAVAVVVADGQHVGGTTTHPRSVATRSPTKLFGNSSRRVPAIRVTALYDERGCGLEQFRGRVDCGRRLLRR
jgi:hypothetical protein